MFRTLVASDDAVKTVFDHFRNLGIAGAVFAAGAWTISNPASGFLSYMSWMSGFSLIVIGCFLFCLAERHGKRKFQEAKISTYWEVVIVLFYAFGVMTFFLVTALRVAIQ